MTRRSTACLAFAALLGCGGDDDAAAGTETDANDTTSTPDDGSPTSIDASEAGEDVTTTDATSDASTSESDTGELPCAPDPVIPEDASEAVCMPATTTAERIGACLCAHDPDVLQLAARPLDATDLLYYVNRWYSIDPCFPYPADEALLEEIRATYINQVDDLEPELETRCGVYDDDVIDVPFAYTDDDDQLRAIAWDSAAPADYPLTIAGVPVGWNDRIGFAAMFAAAEREAGVSLVVVSGFRDLARQKELFESYAEQEGDPAIAAVYSAWPAHSEHQLGTTADVGYIDENGVVDPFAPLAADLHWTEAFQWIRGNAHRFGIVTTYQPDRVHVHQYKPEPWHLRFVGIQAADAMFTCELGTEELLAFRYGVTPMPDYADIDLVYDGTLADGWTPQTCAAPP